ncbi:unnamed protein product [Ambrosiozyma monospora]|uniref:Unnamed protein product n=1 Tax=Ambrosiozyma monospora TaxID=43982 RepID=A0ACB5T8Q0_AMBMO|nr:unnamed protein product [Ambrosiozyma monospora]
MSFLDFHWFTKLFKRNKNEAADIDDIESNSNNTSGNNTPTSGTANATVNGSPIKEKDVLKVGGSSKRLGAPSFERTSSSSNSEMTGTTAYSSELSSNGGSSSAATSAIYK